MTILYYTHGKLKRQDEYILKAIFATLRGKKVKAVGKILNLLTLLVAISKCLAERISEEKGVGLEKAEDIVVDYTKDGMKTVKE